MVNKTNNDTVGNHNLILQNRAYLELTGITDVDCFNDLEIKLFTELGELTIRGHNLHINEMSVDSGKLTVEGEVSALIYGEKDRTKRPTLLGKLFR